MPRWIRRVRARIRYWNRDTELREELDAHRALAQAALEADGILGPEARVRAARLLGNEVYQRETAREAWMGRLGLKLGHLSRDIRHAGRRLIRTPVFSVFSIVSLALGIGATTAVYAAIEAVSGPTPGVGNLDRVVSVQHTAAGSIPMVALSWADFQDLRSRQTVFDRLAPWTSRPAVLVANGRTQTMLSEAVGGEYFEALGIRAAAGRLLGPSDDRADSPPAVVISDRTWERLFERSPEAIGSTVRLNEGVFTIVGITDRAFAGSYNGGITPTSAWISLSALRNSQSDSQADFTSSSRSRRWVLVKGRLASGQTVEQAQAAVRAIAGQLDAEFPIGTDLEPRFRSPYNISRPWVVIPGGTSRFDAGTKGVVRPVSLALLIATGLVLLVACTNLANLSLARWTERRQELAVRMAIGASRWRVVREMATESAVVALLGGALGLGVAHMLTGVLSSELTLGRGFTLRIEPLLSLDALAAAGAATFFALLVAGVIPSIRSTRYAVRDTLASEGLTSTPRWRGRRYLITAQVAVSVLLVSLAGLALRHVMDASAIPTGVDLDHMALAQVDFVLQGYDDARAMQLTDAVVTLASQQPGVRSAAAVTGLPVGPLRTIAGASVRDPLAQARTNAEYVAATPGVFETLGISILHGRAFDSRDEAAADDVAVLSEGLAGAIFGTTDALGRIVEVQRGRVAGRPAPGVETRRVIGIARHLESAGEASGRQSAIYLPMAQAYDGRLLFVVRTDGDPTRALVPLQQAIHSVDRQLGLVQSGTGRQIAGTANLFFEVAGTLASVLGGFALALALTGLHGVLSQITRTRTREIGLRRALGMPTNRVYRSVMREGLSPVVLGLVAGLGFAAIAGMGLVPMSDRLMPALDPWTLTVVPLLFLLASILACYGPARRAARIQPTEALRQL